MNAQSLFMMMGAESVHSADFSAYENPDFIIDLNKPVDPAHYNQFDVIMDAGTLEHVFDVATAFDNVNRMLRVGGNVVIFVPASNAIDHGFYSFSPTLFFDYFGDNGYSQMSCYLIEGSPFLYEKKCRVFRYNYVGRERPLVSSKGVGIGFVATKLNTVYPAGPITPVQRAYRTNHCAGVVPEEPAKTTSPTILGKAKGLLFNFLRFAAPCCPYFLERLTFGKYANKGVKYVGTY
jgi:SAM-dependent methyltransferase